MYDKKLNKTFDYSSIDSQTIEWYGQNKEAEPIWITNQRAGGGRRSAAEWIGAGITFNDQSPIYIPFNNTKPYTQLIDEFIKLFISEHDPINFGAMYFDEPGYYFITSSKYILNFFFLNKIFYFRLYWSFVWSLFKRNGTKTLFC